MDDMKSISVEDAFAVFSTEPKDEVETQEMTKADALALYDDEPSGEVQAQPIEEPTEVYEGE